MPLSRRQLLKLVAMSSASIVISSGIQGCLFDPSASDQVTFPHGVASGDPLSDRVIIWTRISYPGAEPVNVNWEVATDRAFKHIVNSDSAYVDGKTDHTLKVDVLELAPDTHYYYCFNVNGKRSPIGKTKTLSINPEQVNFAVFCCSNFPAGFFHAYKHAALSADSYDAVLHLGDYIYEYAFDDYPNAGSGEAINRVHQPRHECVSLSDYRQRYGQYHRDPDLMALHAMLPFICIWDDHEIANNAYIRGAENHSYLTEGEFSARKSAAIQAWYEWLPVRVPEIQADRIRIYRQFDFGQILSLILLDTRVVAREKQLDYADYADDFGNLQQFDELFSELENPERQLIGHEQLTWLDNALVDSKARGVTWQVLGQQVLMSRIFIPASFLKFDPFTGELNPVNFITYFNVFSAYQVLVKKVVAALVSDGLLDDYIASIAGYSDLSQIDQNRALLELLKVQKPDLYDSLFVALSGDEQQILLEQADLLNTELNPSIPYNLDAWDGYDAQRSQLLEIAKRIDANLLVLSGDSHNGWCNYISDSHEEPIGIELGVPSVSSPGLEKELNIPGGYEKFMENSIVDFIKDVEYFNASQRGYLTIKFSLDTVQANCFVMPREAEKSPIFPDFELSKTITIVADNSNVILHD